MTEKTAPTATVLADISKTKPFTRVEKLPRLGEGIQLPDGYTPAYFRKRHGLAVLRSKEDKHYLVFSVATGDFIKVVNTREASKTMAAIGRGEITPTGAAVAETKDA